MEDKSTPTGKQICGLATAAKMTAEQKKERAINAAKGRWDDTIPKAIKAGEINIGGLVIPCAVLSCGKRLITERGMLGAIGRNKTIRAKKDLDDHTPGFLSAINLKPFITKELESMWTPIKFRLPKDGGFSGNIARGYDARILPGLCNVILDAKEASVLMKHQLHIADRCRILQKGFSVVGLIALIDEATGFQQLRDRDALQQILETYLRKELAVWVKRFPDTFYREIYRLKGWEWKGMGVNRYPIIGKFTTDLVYERIGIPLLEEMKNRSPKDENGIRKTKLHQLLSDDLGIPKLSEHFCGVIALQKASENWEQFYELMEKIFPKKTSLVQLDLFTPIEK